ncbi:MAG: T4SS-associated protein EirA [Gammaproteobacteria bacterium]|nr:T4SS-associated protein EirA [Gammaproteobacteria bacterium]
MKLVKLLFFLIVSFASFAVLAENNTQSVKIFCPSASSLERHALAWRVGDKWISGDNSFVQTIARFIGAQWVGVNVGQIICIYQGSQQQMFPVALRPVHAVLISKPTGSNWHTTHFGYMQCASGQVEDCPFYQQIEKKNTDLYKDIEYKVGSQNNGDSE